MLSIIQEIWELYSQWPVRLHRKREFQIPFSLHNYQVKGQWKPSTAGDIVLAIGNNPQAPPGTDYGLYYMDDTDALKHWKHLNTREENPVSLKSSMFSWILSEPFEWLELKARVAMLFFSRHEGYNNINLKITRQYASWFKFPFISFWVIAHLTGGRLLLMNFLLCLQITHFVNQLGFSSLDSSTVLLNKKG